MRGIEIEIPDQSDALPSSVLKEQVKRNKLSVQNIIDSILSSSSKYTSISISLRSPQSGETLTLINQTSYSLFRLFISSDLCEIVAKNINLKASKKHFSNSFKHQRR
jgi:hypothetical protein